MIPTLGNVDAEAYAAIFKEAGKILRLRRIQGQDIHELTHVVVERFFLTAGNEPLSVCVDRILAEESLKMQPETPMEEQVTLGDTGSIEATLDLYKLYLKVSDKFSGDEKIVFFSMLDENPLTGIADRLNMSQSRVNEIKKSILEKIKNAVPGAKNSRSWKTTKK
jgi:hypothetical protein